MEDSLAMLERHFGAPGVDKRHIVCTVVYALFWPDASIVRSRRPADFRQRLSVIYERMGQFPNVRFIVLPPPDIGWRVENLEFKRARAPSAARKNFKNPFNQRERDQYRIAQELVKSQQRRNVFVVNPVALYKTIAFAGDGLHFSNEGGDAQYKLSTIVCNALNCGQSMHQLLLANDQLQKDETRAFPPRPDRYARMIFPKFTDEQFDYWNYYSA